MNFVAWGLLFIQFIFDLSILLGLLFFDDKTVIKNQNEHRCNKGKRKSTVYLFIALFNESKGIKILWIGFQSSSHQMFSWF